jgi:hypothetical protein
MVGEGVGWRVEGEGGVLVRAGLFSLGRALVLPGAFSVPTLLLASLERGHQCPFAALQVANLHLQSLHYWCGVPWVASTVAFWCSHLDVWFLFHVSCFFSLWAWVASLVPFARSKKA